MAQKAIPIEAEILSLRGHHQECLKFFMAAACGVPVQGYKPRGHPSQTQTDQSEKWQRLVEAGHTSASFPGMSKDGNTNSCLCTPSRKEESPAKGDEL